MADFNDKGFDASNNTGKLGEQWFHDRMNSNGYDTVDVSDDLLFRLVDVDLIAARKKGTNVTPDTVETIKSNMEKTGNFTYDHKKYSLIEIKTDTFCGKMCKENEPCNFYAEFIAHYNPGCFVVTRADKWAYIAWDAVSNIPMKLWIVDISLLRSKIVCGVIKPFDNGVLEYRSSKSTNGKDPGQYAWKIPMNYLIGLGVATEWSTSGPFSKIEPVKGCDNVEEFNADKSQ